MTEHDEEALKQLQKLNEYQGLRYTRTGIKRFPVWDIVGPLTIQLFNAVATKVGWRKIIGVGDDD